MIDVGSAVHVLGQPTPPGIGAEGHLVVLTDALVVTEKVCVCSPALRVDDWHWKMHR